MKQAYIQLLSRISPKLATRIVYKNCLGRKINLKNPRYFCEKLHYLKLNDYYNNPLVTACIDKYTVKQYMKSLGKEELCAKLYGVYSRPEEIEWEKLPDRFVIKCTHGCDYNIVCRSKEELDTKQAEGQLNAWLKEDYWVKFAETQYRFVRKRIIIEEYLGDNLITYRFCCFNGVPKMIYIMSDEADRIVYFDTDWNKLDYKWQGMKTDTTNYGKPENLQEMLAIAADLSRAFPFVRIDLYNVDGRIYLSEYTFVPAGGIMMFEKRSTAALLGRWIKLNE